MQQVKRLVVIGGDAAGMSAASQARRQCLDHPETQTLARLLAGASDAATPRSLARQPHDNPRSLSRSCFQMARLGRRRESSMSSLSESGMSSKSCQTTRPTGAAKVSASG